MVTIRTYANPAEAALAKSLLDSHSILCRLEDEDMNRYGGAPLAIPIRLMVEEDHAIEAIRVLETPGAEISETEGIEQPEPESKTPPLRSENVLDELQKLSHSVGWILILSVVTFLVVAYLIFELPRRSRTRWTPVSDAVRLYDYERALAIAKKIAADYPSDSYAHEYLGYIYFQMGRLHEAEAEYTLAYDLSPPQGIKQKLDEVRQRINRESKVQPSATPLPWP
jgi:tetratricopeptide (TPR) repeat protein